MGLQIIENHIRRERGLPDDFAFSRHEWLKDGGVTSMMKLTGGRCPLYKRGPQKGKPNYSKMVDEQSFYLTVDQIAELRRRYEIETGNCYACEGSGQTIASVSVRSGTEYRVCAKCGGSGKAVPSGAVRVGLPPRGVHELADGSVIAVD